jgi:hypothetical protein
MEPQQKHLSPWIAWGLVILAFGVALFCIWYYYFQVGVAYENSTTDFLSLKKKTTTTATPATSTADWKTYTNDTYGVSFKYPKDWTFTETSLTNSLLNVNATNATVKSGTDNPGLASVTVYQSLDKLDTKNLNPTSIKDYLDKYAGLSDPIYQNIVSKTIADLSGYTAKMGPNQLGGGSVYVITLNSGKIVVIRTYNTGITQDQIDNILSTLKFTK